jgi:hypothetical protein
MQRIKCANKMVTATGGLVFLSERLLIEPVGNFVGWVKREDPTP